MNRPFPRFSIIRASAGSGKTHAIKEAYVDLLHRGIGFDAILALTFTNKAAFEMKARILDSLAKDPALQELQRRLLVNYDYFAVGTLDAFYQRILHEFLHELGLSSYRRIELNWEHRLPDLTHTFFAMIHRDAGLRRLISDFLARRTDEGESWNIVGTVESALRSNIQRIYHEGLTEPPPPRFDRLAAGQFTLRKRRDQLLDETAQLAQSILHTLGEAGICEEDFKRAPQNSWRLFLERRAARAPLSPDKDFKLLDKDPPKRALRHAFKKAALERLDPFLPTLERRWTQLLERLQRLYLAQHALDVYLEGALLAATAAVLHRYKSRQKVLFLADAPHLLESLLTLQQLPFVYEKMGVRYRHLIFDEFQDTSSRQWHVLAPLVEEAMGGAGSALLVGDPKQAIYGWRGGESLLIEAIEQTARHRQWPLETPRLTQNWRSCRTIVEFNNQFFDWLRNAVPDIQSIYEGHHQSPARFATDEGHVQLEMFAHSRDEPATPRILDWLVGHVSRLQDAGVQLRGILVLVRTRQEAEEAARALMAAGYPTITDTSFRMDRLPPIQWMMALLRLSTYPSDAPHHLFEAAVLHHRLMPHVSIDAAYQRIQSAHDEIQRHPPDHAPDLIHEWATRLQWHQHSHLVPYFLYFEEIIQKLLPETDGSLPQLLEHLERHLSQTYLPLPEDQDGVRVLTIHKAKGLDAEVVILPFTHWPIELRGHVPGRASLNDTTWVPFTEIAPYLDLSADDFPNLWLPLRYRKHIERRIPEAFHEQIHQMETAYRIEQINLLYVALTRARFALYAAIRAPGRSESSAGSLLQAFATEHGTFEWGNASQAIKAIQRFQRQHLSTPTPIPIASMPPPRPDRPGIAPSDQWADSLDQWRQLETARQEGIHWHRILRKARTLHDIPEHPPHLRQMVQQPAVAPYFDPEALTEWEVATEYPLADDEGQIHILDRIAWHRHRRDAVVIDYKFTSRPRAPHIRQMKKYLAVLHQKGWNARGMLVFPHEVVEVSPEPTMT